MTIPDMAAPPVGIDLEAWKAAQEAVRGYCGWHIAPSVTQKVTLDGPGGRLLLLPSLHVTEVVTVVNDGAVVTDPEWSASGMIRGCWSSRFRGIEVTFTHGFNPVPQDLLEVVTQMASYAQELVSAGASGIATQMASGPHSFSVSPAAAAGAVGLSGQHRGTLARFKLPFSP